jgi:hypothetical protein
MTPEQEREKLRVERAANDKWAKENEASQCPDCGRYGDAICFNTRDMTDRAIDGDEVCFEALAKAGWGESGERYVRMNKQRVAQLRDEGGWDQVGRATPPLRWNGICK